MIWVYDPPENFVRPMLNSPANNNYEGEAFLAKVMARLWGVTRR
jgi:hypothetical protein